MMPGSILLPIGLFLNGWTAQNHVFWLVPDIVSPSSSFLRLTILMNVHHRVRSS